MSCRLSDQISSSPALEQRVGNRFQIPDERSSPAPLNPERARAPIPDPAVPFDQLRVGVVRAPQRG